MRSGFGFSFPSRRGPSGPLLGPEIAVNGEFDTASNWTLGTGWQISSGQLFRTEVGTSSSASQNSGALIAGATYQISFPMTGASGSDNRFLARLLGASTVSGQIQTGNGVYLQNLVAPNSPTGFSILAVGGFAGVISSFSIRRVLG
jgi:hypothetical protein